jgi:hypothetical protein
MTTRACRVILLVLAVSAAYVGLWAVLLPHSFYDSFPGAGHRWVSMDGPYNEHLVRDVGALYLSLLVFSVGASVRAERPRSRLTGAAWLVFSVPHLAYHATHLAMFGATDQILMMAALGGTAVLAALLCLPAHKTLVSA